MDLTDQYISRVGHLPPAPTVVTELLQLFSDSDSDVDRVVELISHEPALTAEVLKRCNSAVFSGREPVSDMFEAVSRVGFYEVYCAVVGLVGARTLQMGKGGFDVDALWSHSVVAAVAAATLARRVEVIDAMAFTAGLLHDIGKLVFASVESARYGEMVKRAGGFGPAFAEAERSEFGVTHAAVGARLLARWRLPAPIAMAVLHHHEPPRAILKGDVLTNVVRLGNSLAHHIESLSKGADAPPCEAESLSVLKLSPQEAPALIEQIQGELERVQAIVQTQNA